MGNQVRQSTDGIHVDGDSKTTDANAKWTIDKLKELKIIGKPLVYVNFPVLARGGKDALVHHGLPPESLFAAFPAEEKFASDVSIGANWLEGKMKAMDEGTWSGK